MNRSERAQPESSGGHLQELSRTRPILHVNSATAQTWVAIKRRIARPSQWPEANDLTKSIFSCNHHVAVRREIFRGLHRPVRPHCCNGALPKIQRCSQFKNFRECNFTFVRKHTGSVPSKKKSKTRRAIRGLPFKRDHFQSHRDDTLERQPLPNHFPKSCQPSNRDVNIGEPSHSRSGVLLSPSLAETDARAIEQM